MKLEKDIEKKQPEGHSGEGSVTEEKRGECPKRKGVVDSVKHSQSQVVGQKADSGQEVT